MGIGPFPDGDEQARRYQHPCYDYLCGDDEIAP